MLHHGRRAALANSAAPSDAKFNYVTMLLHGDGTNGAQNNTFLDSSSNAFTITRNGNTTQGSFSPYGSNWSNYFLYSATSYLDIAGGSTLALGTGDFTIEFWINPASYPQRLFGWTVSSDTSFGSEIDASGHVWFGGWTTGNTSVSTITLNVWTHLAYTRASGVERLFINGVLDSSATRSTNYSSTANLSIGRWANTTTPTDGYISNFRLVKGTALYTSSFTPSVAPLTAVSGTQVLTCQSNRFVDNSSNAFAITVNGTPKVQRFNPFGTSTAYSTATIGGSGYFDGAGDYLLVPDNAALDLGSSNFTIEAWIYPTAYPGDYGAIVSKYASGFQDSFYFLFQSSGAIRFGTDSAEATTSTTLKINNWSHVAVTRSGSTFTIWINGVNAGGFTNSSAVKDATSRVCIGNMDGYSQLFTGYITDVRIVKGTAVYSTTFTPPTAPLTAITNTSLLCLMQNGAIYDNAMMNDLETVGNAQISTSVKKYGTGSLYFDGTGDYLQLVNNGAGAFGTGDFTVELWLNTSTTTGNRTLIGYSTSGSNSWVLAFNSTTLYWVSSYGVTNLLSKAGGALQDGNWHHLAICRSGTTTRMFFDGVQQTSATDTTNYGDTTNPIQIGVAGATYGSYLGYIDDLRITKGYARYTTTFTPPTAALPDKGPISS